MINRNLFDPEAPIHLPIRYHHDECSEGKNACLIITRVETGWKWFCHRCKKKGFKPLRGLSTTDTIKFISSAKVVEEKYMSSISLPDDFSYEIPDRGLAWLYKYITDEDIYYHRIGYSTTLNRVVFPVYEDNSLVYWQGRYLSKPDKYYPKWNNQKQLGRKDIYFKVVDGEVITTTIILVEDILSAIKVGKTTNCYALLGSYIPDSLIHILKKEYSKVLIWLDVDMLKSAIKFKDRFKMFGMDCQLIYTMKDPKEYSLTEIEKIGGLHGH